MRKHFLRAAYAVLMPLFSSGLLAYEDEAYVVRGRSYDLVGKADAASQGLVGREDLAKRPLLRPGELVETVPGVIASSHAGAGKANQYYARGFNLDHGTDFAVHLEGMPVNLRSHAHGQGYTDLNLMIPELVEELSYEKGPYGAHDGDFSAVGAAKFSYVRGLKLGILKLSQGEWGHQRGVFAASPQLGPGILLYGVELSRNNGPWDRPEEFGKFNGLLKYSLPGISLTFSSYRGSWNSTNQVPQRALDQGLISRYGTMDPSDGGASYRHSWMLQASHGNTRGSAYLSNYGLNLLGNASYYTDPLNSDQVEQVDRRWMGGGELVTRLGETTLGVQARRDDIQELQLWGTLQRARHSLLTDHQVLEDSLGAYVEQKLAPWPWLRAKLGARGDYYEFRVNGQARAASLFSPKAGLVIGPFARTEAYLNYGQAFHSNDARGVLDPLDPATPLVRLRGMEAGLRSSRLRGLQASATLWGLDVESELIYVGDLGATQSGRPSRRWGLEFSSHWQAWSWLGMDADYSWSQARYSDADPAGDHVPSALEDALTAGLSVELPHGLSGSLRLRYFGPRALVEDNSVRSPASLLANARLGWEPWPGQKLELEIFNVFDSKASEVDYYYESQMLSEAAPVGGLHTHPSEPRQLRVTYGLKF